MCEKRSSVNGKIRGKLVRLDSCLRVKIDRLNKDGFRTVASCCGHGRYPETILYRTAWGSVGVLGWPSIQISRTRNFYRQDSHGFYYIPEIQTRRYKNR